MAYRTILYGYEYISGIYKPLSSEASVIKRIYGDYLNGLSYIKIAGALTGEKVHFCRESYEWNKSRVKRILEDSRYTGTDTFPLIIQREDYDEVQRIIQSKNRGYNIDAVITALKNKGVCAVCGTRITLSRKSRFYHRWQCGNFKCNAGINLPCSVVPDTITAILNAVINNHAKLNGNDNTKKHIAPDIETTARLNDINRKLSQNNIVFEDMKADIYAYADMLYQRSAVGISDKLTKRLTDIFNQYNPINEFDTVLFDSAVSNFMLSKDGTVTVRFINGKEITQRLEGYNINAEKQS